MAQLHIPSSVLFRDLGGEAVLLELESGCYYGLDEVGTKIWGLFQRHADLERVERELLAEYDVDRDQLGSDLASFVRALAERGLVTLHDEPIQSVDSPALE